MFSNSNGDSCIKLIPAPVPHLCSSPILAYWWLANLTLNFPSLTDLTDQTSKATGPVGGNLSTLHDPGSRILDIFQDILSARKSPTIKNFCCCLASSKAVWRQVNFTSQAGRFDQFDWGLHDGHFYATLIFQVFGCFRTYLSLSRRVAGLNLYVLHACSLPSQVPSPVTHIIRYDNIWEIHF